MGNFFYRIQNAIARFMYGRNGGDQLNMALLVVYLIVWVLGTILYRVTGSTLVYSAVQAVMVVLAVAVVYRSLSKNLPKRRGENAKFLNWWYPVKSRFTGAKQRHADKAHKYFTCKTCKTICRVPVGKGKIEITCPKCGGKIKGKS